MADPQIANLLGGVTSLSVENSRKSYLDKLPNETMGQILENVSHRDIYSVARCSRALRDQALPSLYRKLTLRCGNRDDQYVSPRLIDCVVKAKESHLPATREIRVLPPSERWHSHPTSRYYVHHAMQNQVRMFVKMCSETPNLPYPADLCLDVGQRFQETLVSLSISRTHSDSRKWTPPPQQAFQGRSLISLKKLSFYQLKGSASVFQLIDLLCAAARLKSLRIHVDPDWTESFRISTQALQNLDLSQLAPASLKRLALENYVLYPKLGTVLSRISALESLEIKSCLMNDNFLAAFNPNVTKIKSFFLKCSYEQCPDWGVFILGLPAAVNSFCFMMDGFAPDFDMYRGATLPFPQNIIERFRGNLKAFGYLAMSGADTRVGDSVNCEGAIELLPESIEQLLLGLKLELRTPRSWAVNKPNLELAPFKRLKNLKSVTFIPSSAEVNDRFIGIRRLSANNNPMYIDAVPMFFVTQYSKLG
ncbi:hypothetical protein TWF281_002356 [Arthrobotrys megalospora]